MTRGFEMRCFVPGCPRTDVEEHQVWIGGERITVASCPPHAAEYRIEECDVKPPVVRVLR